MAVEKETFTIEVPVYCGNSALKAKVQIEAITQWAAVEMLGNALAHLVKRAPQPNEHGVDPGVVRSIKKFLVYSFSGAEYRYDGLSAAEQALTTPEAFADLVRWLQK